MSTRQCPQCQSTKFRPLGEIERIKLELPSFTICGYSKCDVCGHVWEPSAPNWAAGVAWGAAVLLLVGAGFVYLTSPEAILGWVSLAGIAVTVIVSLVKRASRKQQL